MSKKPLQVKAWAVVWYNGQFVRDGKVPVIFPTKKAAKDVYISSKTTRIVRVTIKVDAA